MGTPRYPRYGFAHPLYIEDVSGLNDGALEWTTFTFATTFPTYGRDPLSLQYEDTSVASEEPGSKHYYFVRGVNDAGVGVSTGRSDAIFVAGKPATPAPPVVVNVTTTSVVLQWKEPYAGRDLT